MSDPVYPCKHCGAKGPDDSRWCFICESGFMTPDPESKAPDVVSQEAPSTPAPMSADLLAYMRKIPSEAFGAPASGGEGSGGGEPSPSARDASRLVEDAASFALKVLDAVYPPEIFVSCEEETIAARSIVEAREKLRTALKARSAPNPSSGEGPSPSLPALGALRVAAEKALAEMQWMITAVAMSRNSHDDPAVLEAERAYEALEAALAPSHPESDAQGNPGTGGGAEHG